MDFSGREAARSRKIVLAIGLPGCGKSTYFARKRIVPLSSDWIRQLLYDNPADQRRPDVVFRVLRYLLCRRLESGARINYVDATNLTRREREPFFRIAEEFGCAVEALFFDVPLEICLERNRKRVREVPEEAIQRMAKRLEPPSREEGFRRILMVRPRPVGSAMQQHGAG